MNPKPTEAQMVNLIDEAAYFTGRGSAWYKRALDHHAAGNHAVAQFLIDTMPKEWVPLVENMQAAGQVMKS